MTTRIISKAQADDMAEQLASLGGIVTRSETGVYVTTPKSKREVFRAMIGTAGDMLARWPNGLFDERTQPMTISDMTIAFDILLDNAKTRGYEPLVLDENDRSLCLLADGKTAVVFCRYNGEIKRFIAEAHFIGGHWSDIDIDNAIYN